MFTLAIEMRNISKGLNFFKHVILALTVTWVNFELIFIHGAATPKCQCGFPEKDSGRIRHGYFSKPGQFPHMAVVWIQDQSIYDGNLLSCSGSLISPRFVLTAAHCFYEILDAYKGCVVVAPANSVTVHINEYDLNITDGEVKIKASNVEINPWHVPYTGENDIALVKLSKSARDFKLFSVAYICLNFLSRENKVGRNVTFAGWGLTDKLFNKTVLQYGFSSIISDEECSSSLQLPHIFICTKNPSDTLVGTCEGDSGGPLIATVNGLDTLLGVHRGGPQGNVMDNFDPCKSPMFYSTVSKQINWILSSSDAGSCNFVPGHLPPDTRPSGNFSLLNTSPSCVSTKIAAETKGSGHVKMICIHFAQIFQMLFLLILLK